MKILRKFDQKLLQICHFCVPGQKLYLYMHQNWLKVNMIVLPKKIVVWKVKVTFNVLYYTYGTNQLQLKTGHASEMQKNACDTRAHAKIKFCMCLRVLIITELVAEYIYSC